MGDDCGNAGETGIVVRGPMLPIAGAFIFGIIAALFLPFSAGFWVASGVAGLAGGILCLIRRNMLQLATIFLLISVFAIGAARMTITYFSVPADSIVTFTGPGRTLSTIRGCVASYPRLTQPDVEFGYKPQPAVQFLFQARAILTDTGWQDTTGLVRVTIAEAYKIPQPGSELELIGWISRFRSPRNPGQFDTEAAAKRDGTFVNFRVACGDGAIVLARPDANGWRAIPDRLRATVQQRLTESGDLQGGRLLTALVLGERHPGLSQLNDTMKRAGVAHFLSISGMHLGVFLGFIYLLCRVMTISRRKAAIVVLVALGAYLLVAEPRAPLLRSAVMATALAVAAISGRRHSALNALAAAAVILLAYDPRGLLSPGFQLSFVIVGGLILFRRPMLKLLFGRWLDARGLMVFRGGQGRFKRWLRFSFANWIIDAVSMSVTAYLVAAPLVAHYFGLFSPYGIILGLILFPLVVATLIPGYLALGLAWPLPNLSAAFASAAASVANIMARFVDALNFLPMLCVELRPVGPGWVLLCYATLTAVMLTVGKKNRAKIIIIALLFVAFIGVTVWTQLPAGRTKDAELHMLSVGAGQCIVLKTPEGRTYIFDAGTRSGFDAYSRALEPFMREMKLPQPTAAFVSHANADHYSALSGMMRKGALDQIYICDYFDKPGQGGNAASMHMIELMNEHNVKIQKLRAGDTLQLDAHTRVEVLWPPHARRSDLSENDTSLVLRVTCDGKSVLIPGDVSTVGQAELMKPASLAKLQADVLVMPHHGGWADTLPDFVRTVMPKIILASGMRNPSGPSTGSAEVRDFYKSLRTGYRFYSSTEDGWVCLKFGKTGMEVKTMKKK